MSHFIPREYQHLITSFAAEHPRCNIFAGMGLGKTSSSIEVFDTLRMFGEVKRALVLAPKRVAQNSWPDELVKWKESFGHLTMAAAVGSADQRLAALRQTPDILTTNYENIEWLIEQYGDNWPFEMVFADESTKLKSLRVSIQTSKKGKEYITGQGGSRAGAIARVAHTKVRRWVNLTGSPAPNGIVDCWGQQWFIDGGRSLGNSFTAYKQRFFQAVPGGNGYSQIEPLSFSQKIVEGLMRPTSITIDAKDWFDIDAVIERNVYVDLPPGARKQYAEMQKDLFTWVEANPVEAFNAGAKSLKCLQLASGSVFTDKEGNWSKVHDEKIDALKSIVAEANGEPILVAYQFVPDKLRILQAFPGARTLDHKNALKDFQAGKIPMLVVHPQSAGHGLDMQQNCRILVDYSSGYNLEHDEQVIERIGPTRQAQIGKKVAVFRYRIIARQTIEETVVLPRLKTKASIQDCFKAAMKIR